LIDDLFLLASATGRFIRPYFPALVQRSGSTADVNHGLDHAVVIARHPIRKFLIAILLSFRPLMASETFKFQATEESLSSILEIIGKARIHHGFKPDPQNRINTRRSPK